MGDKYRDSGSDVDDCLCTDADYGWCVFSTRGVPPLTRVFYSDYNYSREGEECVPIGPEPIPAGACIEDDRTYQGPSGYRLLAGNTCKREGGVKKDELVTKDCTESTILTNPVMTMINDAQLRLTREKFPTKLYVSELLCNEDLIILQFTFASRLMSYHYFGSSKVSILNLTAQWLLLRSF